MRKAALVAGLLFAAPAYADSPPAGTATPPTVCDATSAPQRTGKPLPGGDDLIPVVVSATIAADAVTGTPDKPAAPIAWCLEASEQRGDRHIEIWHDPADPASSRATMGSGGYELRAFLDTLAPTLLKDQPGVTIYDLFLVQGDRIQVVGFFDGPPPIDAMVAFFVRDRFGVYADIDVKTHKVTIYRPF